ncbi:hypothetical protein [Burkholderia gladioli]|uniref:hypothetical protein n=2 Tax=Burkholderia gladioli TaxID=28095 RepID=UPI001F154383|nr:hypothetical protein [Burkholderia gladioli]
MFGFSTSRKRKTQPPSAASPCTARFWNPGLWRMCTACASEARRSSFPSSNPAQTGTGKTWLRRFADYLGERKIVDDRKVFHSFRHTFINRMTELHTHPAMLMALIGHYDQVKVDFSSPHFANYQHAKPLVELKSTIDRFDLILPICF